MDFNSKNKIPVLIANAFFPRFYGRGSQGLLWSSRRNTLFFVDIQRKMSHMSQQWFLWGTMETHDGSGQMYTRQGGLHRGY